MNENFNRRVRHFLLFDGEAGCSYVGERCRSFLKELSDFQEDSQKALNEVEERRKKLTALSQELTSSPIFSLLQKKKGKEIELQLLLVAQELQEIPETVEAVRVPRCIVNICKIFPCDISSDAKICRVLKDRLEFLQRRFLSEFHLFLDAHMTLISKADSSQSIWIDFFEKAKDLLLAYFSVSLLPCAIFHRMSEPVAKYKECLDAALTPIWGRFHFHLCQARVDRSHEQLIWTFTYAQSFVHMLLSICSATSSSNELQNIVDENFESASKEQICSKAAKFMRAHILHIIEDIPLEPQSVLIQIIESSLELDGELSAIVPVVESVSSMIALNPRAFSFWISCDFLYAKRALESVCEPESVYSPAFPAWDESHYCYSSLYECISLFKTFLRRHRYQPAVAQRYIAEVFLEPLLSLMLGLLLLRIRSCVEIRDLSNSRFPFWVGKSAGFDGLPSVIKAFFGCINYIDDAFEELRTDFKADSNRFLAHWKELKKSVSASEWNPSSAANLVSKSMQLSPVPSDINSEVFSPESQVDVETVGNLSSTFRAQLKAMKNAVEIQIYETLDRESEILLN